MKTDSRPAFTLIEMIIAITVFTIFIGFSLSTYLVFHRANQDALTVRSMVMDTELLMDELLDAVRENRIDYADFTEGKTLRLVSPDGLENKEYTWDADAETLSVTSGDSTAILHSEDLKITYLNFDVFPEENPYSDRSKDDIQYQPIVMIDLRVSRLGRMDEELSFDLRSSITSRFYQ